MTTDDEVDLKSETNTVHRRGSVVLRDAGPHSATVHALLRHLEAVGFTASPRVVDSGFDTDGRETLGYVEGELMQPGQLSADGARALGILLRDLHNATSTFQMPHDAAWQPWFGRHIGSVPNVIGHCDVAPWNVVTRDGRPVALIDWEHAGPVDPLVELAQAAWLNAGLYSDDIAEVHCLPPLSERAKRLRAIVDGYGLSQDNRLGFIDRMVEFAIHSTAADADEFDVRRDTVHSKALWGMAWRARSAAWMLLNRDSLRNALA